MNALIRISASLLTPLFCLGCASAPKNARDFDVDFIDVISFENLPMIEGTQVSLGGFSGLAFQGVETTTGELRFLTHTDRGANHDLKKDSREKNLRPFVKPDFNPRLFSFRLNPKTKKITNDAQTLLRSSDGRGLTGLPNTPELDETPIDLSDRRIKHDKSGVDTEGLSVDSDGSFWMADEYGPSLLHFDSGARLLSRWIPKKRPESFGQAVLPEWYARRKMNRGFEAIAIEQDLVYALLESPLEGDRDATRLIALDKKTGLVKGEYAYLLESAAAGLAPIEKVSDLVALGNSRFLVVEQNSETDERASHKIYEITTEGATNIFDLAGAPLNRDRVCEDKSCLKPVRKTLIADLVALGLRGHAKIEGLALVDNQTLAAIADNDFDLEGRNNRSALILIRLKKALR